MRNDLFIIDDDDIHKVAVVNKDFHKINQKTYQFEIDYDSSIKYYSTRLGVNVVYLPTGYYTIVFEMYFSDKIDPDEITVNATSGTLSVSQTNTKKSADHTRSVINFNKAVIYPSDDELDIDISLKNKSGQSYDSKTTIFVVVYGVDGTHNDVDVHVWDRYFYISNKKIHFEAPIDMNNKDITSVDKIYAEYINVNHFNVNSQIDMNSNKIINLPYGQSNGEAINKQQFDALNKALLDGIIALQNKIDKISKWYYFTDQLKHNNELIVKFPSDIEKYPFKSVYDDNTKLRILVSGYYHVIYLDNCKYGGEFQIYDDTNGTTKFITHIVNTNYFSQFTINAVINVQTHDGFGHADIKLKSIKTVSSNPDPQLDGINDSSFYIKYLHD